MYHNIEGFNGLSAKQKEVLETVHQKHKKFLNGIDVDVIVKVEAGDHPEQVHVYFQEDWYHYELDRNGQAVWY